MSNSNKKDLSELQITSQDAIDLVYDTLECLHQILTENQIRYTVFGGTALGAERHGGLIPWDDDADVAILSADEQRLVALVDAFARRGFLLDREPCVGYRIYHATLTKPRVYDQYPYPFLDIFLLDDTGKDYQYPNPKAREYWPQRPLPYGCFDRLIDIKFGHLTLRGLTSEDVKCHLDDNYGEDWPHVAWRLYDHYYYKSTADTRIELLEGKKQRPARHSKHPEVIEPLKSVLNQSTHLVN